uniref:Uncharacterized protein n=1 Tax=Rhizophora mucronata TaxID=61149 RepID=A0A2P2NJJ4_RHIMU
MQLDFILNKSFEKVCTSCLCSTLVRIYLFFPYFC